MASISELNIRLGLITKDFSKQLKDMEGRLRQSGQTMSDLGQRMTLGITAPLVGIGIASVKAAGDIEALQKAMEATFAGQGKTIAESNAELDKLRTLALAPGLDFEQAVRGSIRLQNVGFQAEVARDVIKELANAIALTGGGADDLNEVVNQFSQMIGKGKVFQDDLKIITGRMPVVATLMKNAFGTTTAEGINKLGIGSREFVDIITKAAAKDLPRVEGGINNAFVNAGTAAKESMAALGKALIVTFDIVGLLDSFSSALSSVTKWFSELSSGMQSFIGYSAAVVASLGVGIYAYGQYQLAAAAVVKFYEMALLPNFMAVKKAVLALREAFFALSVSMQVGWAVIVVTAITALYFLFKDLSGEMDTAANAGRNLGDAQKYVAQESAKELSVLNSSIATLSDVASSQRARGAAVDSLVKAYPKYLEGMNLELMTAGQLAIVQRELTDEIIRGAAQRAKANAQAELSAKIVEKELALFKLRAAEKDGDFTLQDRSFIIQNEEQKLKSLKDQLEDVGNTYDKIFNQQGLKVGDGSVIEIVDPKSLKNIEAAKEGIAGLTKTEEELAKERSAAKKITDERKKAEDEYWESLGKVNEASEAANEQEQKAIDGAKALLQARERLADQKFGDTKALPQSDPTKLGGFTQKSDQGTFFDVQLSVDPSKAKEAIESLKQPFSKLQAIADTTGRSIGDSIQAAAGDFADFWDKNLKDIYAASQNLAGGLLDLQKARADNEKEVLNAEAEAKILTLEKEYADKIAAAKGNADATAALEAELKEKKLAIEQSYTAKAAAIDKKQAKARKAVAIGTAVIETAVAVSKALALGFPIGPIVAALTAAAGAVQIATIKAQPFADGGVITKPTLGLVGEYAGASSNPEIITPERLMRSIFREESGGANSIQVYGTIRGADIEISNRKAERERGRVR